MSANTSARMAIGPARAANDYSVGYARSDNNDYIYIAFAQCEESAYSTSYIPTTSAATTRAAEQLYYSVSGNLPVNDFWGYCVMRLGFDHNVDKGTYPRMWWTQQDNNNRFGILFDQTTSSVNFQKRILGTFYQAQTSVGALPYSAGDKLVLAWRTSSSTGMKLWTRNVTTGSGLVTATHANTTDAPLDSSLYLGSVGSSFQTKLNFKDFNIFNRAHSDTVIEQVINSL